jgi:hypothetical protein
VRATLSSAFTFLVFVLIFVLPLAAIFFGRGLFNYNMGLMPYRHPIVSVGASHIYVPLPPPRASKRRDDREEQNSFTDFVSFFTSYSRSPHLRRPERQPYDGRT